jgi:hypothetical protein
MLGFTFMLLVEQFLSSHAHNPSSHSNHEIPLNQIHKDAEASTVEFDAELEDGLGHDMSDGRPPTHSRRVSYSQLHHDQGGASEGDQARAYALTLGLVTHALSDGLALGISALSDSASGSSELSLVVFLALLLHKGAYLASIVTISCSPPTALRCSADYASPFHISSLAIASPSSMQKTYRDLRGLDSYRSVGNLCAVVLPGPSRRCNMDSPRGTLLRKRMLLAVSPLNLTNPVQMTGR